MATVTPERLKEVVIEVLKGFGAADDEAPIVAESLVRAEMRGTDTHGLPYLKLLVERVEAGMVSLPTRVTVRNDDGATALLDGGNGIGQIAGWQAMERSIRKAREQGIGLTLVRNTNNLGFLAFYTMHAAEEGFVGVTMGNANAAISPWAAPRPFLAPTLSPSRSQVMGGRWHSICPPPWWPVARCAKRSGWARRSRWDGRWMNLACRPTIPARRSRERCFLSEGQKGTA